MTYFLPTKVRRSPLGRAWHLLGRSQTLARHTWPRITGGLRWLAGSREVTNFTYDISPQSKEHMAHAVAMALGTSPAAVRGYFDELQQDDAVRDCIAVRVAQGPRPHVANRSMPYGRRLSWYAIARHAKPRVIIETGVEKGLGAIVLSAALLRNAAEGHYGRYYGLDISPIAGYLLAPPYDSVADILYGDSLDQLASFQGPIDLFINDSDHTPGYESREYAMVKNKLSEHAIILGDNCHVTDELARFSEEEGRRFLFAKEEPLLGWFPGAGTGISFKERG